MVVRSIIQNLDKWDESGQSIIATENFEQKWLEAASRIEGKIRTELTVAEREAFSKLNIPRYPLPAGFIAEFYGAYLNSDNTELIIPIYEPKSEEEFFNGGQDGGYGIIINFARIKFGDHASLLSEFKKEVEEVKDWLRYNLSEFETSSYLEDMIDSCMIYESHLNPWEIGYKEEDVTIWYEDKNLEITETDRDVFKESILEVYRNWIDNLCIDADNIVKIVRFDDWQNTTTGQKEVRKSLRSIINVKYKIKDNELFEKAYGYVEQYY